MVWKYLVRVRVRARVRVGVRVRARVRVRVRVRGLPHSRAGSSGRVHAMSMTRPRHVRRPSPPRSRAGSRWSLSAR